MENFEELSVFLVKKLLVGSIKLEILRELDFKDYTLENICKVVRISMADACYHINGNGKTIGLLELGFVDKVFIDNKKTNFVLKITDLGREVLKRVD